MKSIIGIAAQAQMGKDTIANRLVTRLNPGWRRVAFATGVKRVFKDTFGVDDDFVEEWKVKTEVPEGFLKPVRQSLQFIGDGFRQIQSDIWIDLLFRKEYAPYIISDCRYVNEAKKIRQEGGFTIVAYRPNFLNDDPNPSESQIKPIVEFCAANLDEGPIPNFTYLKNKFGSIVPDDIQYYDFFIANNGSVQKLYDKIDSILIPYIMEDD